MTNVKEFWEVGAWVEEHELGAAGNKARNDVSGIQKELVSLD